MIEQIIKSCVVETRNLFPPEISFPLIAQQSKEQIIKLKLNDELESSIDKFQKFKDKQDQIKQKQKVDTKANKQVKQQQTTVDTLIKQMMGIPLDQKNKIKSIEEYKEKTKPKDQQSSAVVAHKLEMTLADTAKLGNVKASNIRKLIKPTWHKPYKLYRVVSGHQGWVRSLAISPCNTYFASGSNDRTIKFWDLASGKLKITLTGHINAIRGLQFSQMSPYLFSCAEDKMVKCWDLEMNKVVRSYHGHLSGVYALKLLEPLGVLVTGGRDSAARVWDIRLRTQVYTLTGHSHTVASICTQQYQPQVITGSYDTWIKTWDLTAGKCMNTLTNHKKSVRAMAIHPTQYTFASGASDNIKVWKCPEGQFLRNISGHDQIINSIAINPDNVLVSADNNGTMKFWDWKSGYNFQTITCTPQPGSIAAENGIFHCDFDRSGTRLLTAQCDKTIKFWKQDDDATQQTHPITDFKIAYDYR